jgi:hypothetical protein
MRRATRAPVLATVLAVAAAFAGLAALPACSKPGPPKAELRVKVLPAEGASVATEEDTRIAAGVLDLAIGELGIQRREVLPLPNGYVRVVLPESQRARLPDVRKRLEDPKLRVTVE